VSRQSQADTPSQAEEGPQEGQSQRAKPRGLPSTVQSTVDRIAANTGPCAAVHAQISAESSSAMFAHAQATDEQEQVATVCCEADSASASLDTALLGTLAQSSSAGSPTRGLRSQGKPPLSPVRQSLQDLVLSHDSSPSEHALVPVSIAPVMGMPKQDMNVHCNPLFTDPLAGQPDAHGSPAQKRIADRSDLSHSEQHQQLQKNATVSASAGELKVAGPRAVPSSPPSQLQKSLRAIMQQHAEELEVCITQLLSSSEQNFCKVCICALDTPSHRSNRTTCHVVAAKACMAASSHLQLKLLKTVIDVCALQKAHGLRHDLT